MISNGASGKGAEAKPAAKTGSVPLPDSDPGFGPPHPLDGLMKQIRELVEYANYYVETRKDVMRASVRSFAWKAALGVIAAVVGTTVLVLAAAYLLSGISAGIAWLVARIFDGYYGDYLPLGQFITALFIFGSLVVAAYLGIKSLTRKARKRTMDKYGSRQNEQCSQFGHSVSMRAAEVRKPH